MWVRVGVGVRGVISDKLSRTNSSCLRADFGIGWLTRLLTSLKESIIWRTNIKRINHRFCLFELGSKAEFRPHVPCVPQDRRNTTNWPTLKSSSFAEKCLGTPSRFRPDRKINIQESSLTTESTKSSIVKWSHWLDIFRITLFQGIILYFSILFSILSSWISLPFVHKVGHPGAQQRAGQHSCSDAMARWIL